MGNISLAISFLCAISQQKNLEFQLVLSFSLREKYPQIYIDPEVVALHFTCASRVWVAFVSHFAVTVLGAHSHCAFSVRSATQLFLIKLNCKRRQQNGGHICLEKIRVQANFQAFCVCCMVKKERLKTKHTFSIFVHTHTGRTHRTLRVGPSRPFLKKKEHIGMWWPTRNFYSHRWQESANISDEKGEKVKVVLFPKKLSLTARLGRFLLQDKTEWILPGSSGCLFRIRTPLLERIPFQTRRIQLSRCSPPLRLAEMEITHSVLSAKTFEESKQNHEYSVCLCVCVSVFWSNDIIPAFADKACVSFPKLQSCLVNTQSKNFFRGLDFIEWQC